jgi:hypothetical protein
VYGQRRAHFMAIFPEIMGSSRPESRHSRLPVYPRSTLD